MNQGRGRKPAAYRQKQGVDVPQDASTDRLHPEEDENFSSACDFSAQKQFDFLLQKKCDAISSTQLISTPVTLAYVNISRLLYVCKYRASNLAVNLCFSGRADPAGTY